MMRPPTVTVGLECSRASPPRALAHGRFALLSNHASLDWRFRTSARVLAKRYPAGLVALFSPQHGPHGEAQDNMIETSHSRDEELGLPIWSLYSETRAPRDEMLEGLDAVVIDLQDVGTRVYTFLWTALHCLEACASRGIEVIVLDRPNPLGGNRVEGPRLRSGFESFVGGASLPMAHGLTIAEALLWLRRVRALDVKLSVVPMDGWSRAQAWRETGRAWIPPSPNLPRVDGVFLYPGSVLLEGTHLSEGRGTTTPFEIIGAPYLDPGELVDALRESDLESSGVVVRGVRFRPTFQKWKKESCGGVFLHIADFDRLNAYHAVAEIVRVIRGIAPEHFRWRDPPYEYETERLPIDILAGGDRLRHAIDSGDADAVRRASEIDRDGWWNEVDDVLLYSDDE